MSDNTPQDSDDDRTVIRPSAARPSPAPEQRTMAVAPQPPSSSSSAASSAGDSGNALPLGTYLAEFELRSVLGEGGFGIVYQAWDHSLERKVALKEYMPASLASRTDGTSVQVRSERHRETFEMGRKSFINEAKLLAQFDHPALVKVYRFWEANGTAYMVMPLYDGITLKDWLRQQSGPPDEGWLLTMLQPLTAALSVIHAEHCFHRDIAPDNIILLGGNGARPLLLDFGAARRVIGDMTQALTVILKPGYAPVEQYAEAPHMKQGGWTDVYALAASIHFVLLGKTPPPSVSRMMGDTYEPLSTRLAGQYSETFLSALDRALHVKPEERTQSIEQLRAELGFTEGAGSGFANSQFSNSQFSNSQFAPSTSFRDSTMGESVPSRTQVASRPHPASASGSPAPAPTSGSGSKTGLLVAAAAVVLIGGGAAAYLAMRPATPVPASSPAPVPVTSSAAAPAPAVVAAPAPRRFDASTEFDRVIAGQDASFGVKAVATKQSLRIGKDSLFFTVTSAREGYVQVLLLGPDGSLLELIPNGDVKDNHIRAGQTLKLPPPSLPLVASDPAGTEHFLVVVSSQPRDYSSLSAERDGPFLKLPTGGNADALLAQWPATSPMLLGATPKGCSVADCEAYGAARFAVDVTQ